MPWETLANIAEVFGMMVVVITLIFLTVQMRQNTRAIRLNTFHSVSEAFRSQYALVGANEDVANIYAAGLTGTQDLNELERVRYYALMHNQMRAYENAFYQQAHAALDASYWTGIQQQMKEHSSLPGFSKYWKDRGHWYGRTFQRHMNEVIFPNEDELVLGGGSARD